MNRSQIDSIEVTKRRTAVDYAYLLKDLVDIYYPDALLITVVQDNLNTHSPASLYKAFEPAEARRILNRLEFCYTPKHGSWLNMAEIELSVLARQCLNRRIPEFAVLQTEVAAWEEQRSSAADLDQLALYYRRCTGQTASPLPLN